VTIVRRPLDPPTLSNDCPYRLSAFSNSGGADMGGRGVSWVFLVILGFVGFWILAALLYNANKPEQANTAAVAPDDSTEAKASQYGCAKFDVMMRRFNSSKGVQALLQMKIKGSRLQLLFNRLSVLQRKLHSRH
jgi:hypothetical protein